MKILTYPDSKLRQKAKPLKTINKDIVKLARNMLDLMYKESGIGLAATQISNPIRMLVINLTKKPLDEIILINPKITKKSGKFNEEEGCLSVPGVKAIIPRYKRIICKAKNIVGQDITIDTGNLG